MAIKLTTESTKQLSKSVQQLQKHSEKTKAQARKMQVFVTAVKLTTALHKKYNITYTASIITYILFFANIAKYACGETPCYTLSWLTIVIPTAATILSTLFTILWYCVALTFVQPYKEKFSKGVYYEKLYNKG